MFWVLSLWMKISPPKDGISPDKVFKSVDFPQPLGPNRQISSPSFIEKERPCFTIFHSLLFLYPIFRSFT